jgi:hypothetical protein
MVVAEGFVDVEGAEVAEAAAVAVVVGRNASPAAIFAFAAVSAGEGRGGVGGGGALAIVTGCCPAALASVDAGEEGGVLGDTVVAVVVVVVVVVGAVVVAAPAPLGCCLCCPACFSVESTRFIVGYQNGWEWCICIWMECEWRIWRNENSLDSGFDVMSYPQNHLKIIFLKSATFFNPFFVIFIASITITWIYGIYSWLERIVNQRKSLLH